MADRRGGPSGGLYRPMLDAQAQLCLSLHHSGGPMTAPEPQQHTAYRSLSPSCAKQQLEAEEEVRGLPDVVVAERSSAHFVERLKEKKERDHTEAMMNFHKDLAVVAKDYEDRTRRSCKDLLSFLEETDQRGNSLVEGLEAQQQISLQELNDVWQQVEDTANLKGGRICDLDQTLTGYGVQRREQITVLFSKYCTLLERISCLNPNDVYSLMDTEARTINLELLANRRSTARVRLRLLEEVLVKKHDLRLRWLDAVHTCNAGRVRQEVERIRKLISSESVQEPVSVKKAVLEVKRTQQTLSEEQSSLIQHVRSLAPPNCTTALVTDWFNQLTAVNENIDSCHDAFVRQRRSSFEESWQNCLAEAERCKEVLRSPELSAEEVQHIVSTQILSLIGPCQRQTEERLAILDRDVDVLARHARTWSRTAWNVLKGAALLWERHSQAVETREQQLEEQLRLLRSLQEEEIQRKEAHLDILLDRLRQESTEEGLRSSLDRALTHLEELPHSSRVWYSKMDQVLESFPAMLMDEVKSYSAAVSQYYQVDGVHTLMPEDLLLFYPHDKPGGLTTSAQTELNHSPPPQDGVLTEAEASLAEIHLPDTQVTFTSKSGRAYCGPSFQVPSHDPLSDVHLILFPTEMLTQSLTQLRALSFDHLEQLFHDILSSATARVASMKEALCSELDLRLQLHRLRPQRIEMDIHNMRSAELQVHMELVKSQNAAVQEVLASCQRDMTDLQTSTSANNVHFITSVSMMEELFHEATSSHTLEGLRSSLQERLGQRVQEIQVSQRAFRHSVQQRLEGLRESNTTLLASFRLFGEGGNFSPKEVDLLLALLQPTSGWINALEQRIQADMESLEVSSLEKVKVLVEQLEDKLSPHLVEMRISERTQNVLAKVRVQIKAEAAHSNHQKMVISRLVEQLKKLTESAEVSQENMFAGLSSLGKELKERYQYLDCNLAPPSVLPAEPPLQGSFAVAARRRSGPPPHQTRDQPLAAAGPGGASSDDITMGVDKLKRGLQANENEEWSQTFGEEPHQHQDPRSFKTTINSFLRVANEDLLLVAQDGLRAERLNKRPLGMNHRLLAYQAQAKQFNATSVQELAGQLCELCELVSTLQAVMFGNNGQQQEVELLEKLKEFRTRMNEIETATIHTQRKHYSEVKVRMAHPACKPQLDALKMREEDRQSEDRSTIIRTYEELQEFMRAREQEVKKSLSSLSESLSLQVDALLPLELSEQLATPDTGSGKEELMPNMDTGVDAKATAGCGRVVVHQGILVLRDKALQRFEEVAKAQLDHFRTHRDQLLTQQQRWTQHWKQTISSLSTLNVE